MQLIKAQVTVELLIITTVFSILFLSLFAIYSNSHSIFSDRTMIFTAKTIAQGLANSINNAELAGNSYQEKVFLDSRGNDYSISIQNRMVQVEWQTGTGSSSYSSPLLTSSVVSDDSLRPNSEITVHNLNGVIHVS